MSLLDLFRVILILVPLFSLSNCGGEVTESFVSITPHRPLIYNADRTIFLDIFNTMTIPRPSIMYQIRVNNAGNDQALTIVGLRLTVDGPKGTKIITVDSLTNLFKINGSNFQQEMRAFFVEVPPYQASYCMDKIEFLKQTSYSVECDSIDNDSLEENFKVSARNTVEGDGGRSCCPAENSPGNFDNIYILTGGLQDYSNEENIPESLTLSIRADIQGFIGTFAEPIGNYRTQVNFSPSSN